MITSILDFGTEKIFAGIGRRGLNDSIILLGTGESNYEGFNQGSFFDPKNLPAALGQAILAAEKSARHTIEHIVVGVPSDFTTCICRDEQISLGKKRKVLSSDVDLLHEQASDIKKMAGYTLINSQPIYYTLDDGGRLIDPVGLTSSMIGGHISYILAEDRFLIAVREMLKQLGINSVTFVSNLVSSSMFLFDDITRDRYVVYLDCGHRTTSVAVARGDGILAQYNIPIGGWDIAEALQKRFLNEPNQLTHKQADNLKRRVSLNLNLGEEDMYVIHSTDSMRADKLEYKAKIVNEIVSEVIKALAQTIIKSLKLCTYDFPDYIPFHLGGGGISFIKGAPELLSKHLRRPVEVVAPNLPRLENHPHLSSVYALLDTALRLTPPEPTKPKGLFSRLFRKK